MINLKIDPEFQSQIPPLTDDEFKQLEENILKEGKLLSPLIVWNNTLVDGHNRYEIVQEHPEISFSTMPLPFESREEVLAWICKNQLGRRNLSPEQKRYLLGKQYESEKKAEKIFHGNQYTLAKKSGGDHGDNHHSGKKTCDRIAEELRREDAEAQAAEAAQDMTDGVMDESMQAMHMDRPGPPPPPPFDPGRRSLLEVLLYNEMYKRRCKRRQCRRFW